MASRSTPKPHPAYPNPVTNFLKQFSPMFKQINISILNKSLSLVYMFELSFQVSVRREESMTMAVHIEQ